VVAATDAAPDSYAGDDGEDTLDYSAATQSVVVDVAAGTALGIEIGDDQISGFEVIIGGRGSDRLTAGGLSITMTGGEGDDTFEFSRSGSNDQRDLVRKITDFTVGDCIVASIYEIRDPGGVGDETGNQPDDPFNAIYLSDDGVDHRPVRFRFETLDEHDRTIVDVHDRPDDINDFYSIELNGHHYLHVTVTGS